MKTLIVYATKHGTTEKCAKILKEKLTGEVDLINLSNHQGIDLTSYDKVIIGGSVYVGMVRKQVKEFCVQNINILKEKKLGLFINCMHGDEQANQQLNMAFPNLIEHAVAKDYFGGEFDFSKMNFFERMIVKMVTKKDVKISNDLKTTGKSTMLLENRINDFATLMNKA